jgi:hypothetical protein
MPNGDSIALLGLRAAQIDSQRCIQIDLSHSQNCVVVVMRLNCSATINDRTIKQHRLINDIIA